MHEKYATSILPAPWFDPKAFLTVQGASVSLQMHPHRRGHRARRVASGYMLHIALQILMR